MKFLTRNSLSLSVGICWSKIRYATRKTSYEWPLPQFMMYCFFWAGMVVGWVRKRIRISSKRSYLLPDPFLNWIHGRCFSYLLLPLVVSRAWIWLVISIVRTQVKIGASGMWSVPCRRGRLVLARCAIARIKFRIQTLELIIYYATSPAS